jgi:hypothetical protein
MPLENQRDGDAGNGKVTVELPENRAPKNCESGHLQSWDQLDGIVFYCESYFAWRKTR